MKIKKNILNSITIAIFSVLLTTTSFADIGFKNIFKRIFKKDTPEYTASKELNKKLINQSVTILMVGKKLGRCSGTIIHEDKKNHYVLTAKHCIGITEEMYVEHNKVLYVITSPMDDLALITVDGKIPNKSIAIFANKEIELGEVVHHIGYPSGILYKASGKVTRFTDDWQWFDFKAISGCSGGGIFNENGELVSLLWGGYSHLKANAPLKTVAEPLKDIKIFLSFIGGIGLEDIL